MTYEPVIQIGFAAVEAVQYMAGLQRLRRNSSICRLGRAQWGRATCGSAPDPRLIFVNES